MVLAGGGLLLMGCEVGLLIFQLDALVQPGGPLLHLSRWRDAQHSVTPSHILQGFNMCVCLCEPVCVRACMCVCSVCFRNFHTLDMLHDVFSICRMSQDYIESAI